MILYDFEKIWLLSMGQPKLMIQYFSRLAWGNPNYFFLKGSSFIINPEVILDRRFRIADQKLTEQQKAEHLGMCSLRNYANYRQAKDVDLELEYIPPWVPRIVVDESPLYTINRTKLIFISEKEK